MASSPWGHDLQMSLMNRQFDVIIIGAGPAGLECARVLKDSAYTVLVLEKKNTIGLKPCAGGIVESV